MLVHAYCIEISLEMGLKRAASATLDGMQIVEWLRFDAQVRLVEPLRYLICDEATWR